MKPRLAAPPWLSRAGTLRRIIQIEPRRVLIHTLLWGCLLALLLALPFSLYYQAERQSIRDRQQQDGERILHLAAEALRQELDTTLSDLLFLAATEATRAFLEADTPERRAALAREFLALARHKARYDQVRFIDARGWERVRVNNGGALATVVDEADLQFKGDRPYFRATLALQSGQAHLSPFELNVERGRLDFPHKPVLRLAMPVADTQGRVRGILILNLLGQRLLDHLVTLGGRPGVLWLVDKQGHWLLGPDPGNEWGGSRTEGAGHTLAIRHPALWQRIQSQDQGFHLDGPPPMGFLRVPAVTAQHPGIAVFTGPDRPWTLLVSLAGQQRNDGPDGLLRRVAGLYALWTLFGFTLAGALAFMGQRQSALAHIAERVIDGLPMLVAYVDTELRYRFNNRAYETLFGLTPRQLYGKTMAELLDADTFARLRPLLDQVLSGHPAHAQLSLEHGREGWRDVQISYLPDRQDDGRLRGFFVMVNNITHLKEVERRERQHLLELAHVSRLASLGEMAGEIAHEVNQPLSAIAMFSSASLRRAPAGDAQLRDWLESINAQAKRASEVVRRLRRFVGKGELRPGPVDLNQVAREVVGLMRFEADRLDVALTLEMDATLAPLSAELILVEQVLFNLLRNALEALTGREGPRLILLRTRQDAERAWVEVTDNGPGVDPTRGQDIFEPFMTDKANGLGMGLAISRSIVEAHGGILDHHNNPEGGVTFRVGLTKEVKHD